MYHPSSSPSEQGMAFGQQRCPSLICNTLLSGGLMAILLCVYLNVMEILATTFVDAAYNACPQCNGDMQNEGIIMWGIAVFPLLCSLGFFWAGWLTSRQSGRIVGGTLAGMWTGISGSLLVLFSSLLLQIVLHPGSLSTISVVVFGGGNDSPPYDFSVFSLFKTALIWLSIGGIGGCVTGAFGGAVSLKKI